MFYTTVSVRVRPSVYLVGRIDHNSMHAGSCASVARGEVDDGQHGPTVEAVMVLVLREAYSLAADRALRRRRNVVSTDDVVLALKVLAHPSCDFLDTLAPPSRAEHASGSRGGLERAVQSIESCALALSAGRVTLRADGLLACCPLGTRGGESGGASAGAGVAGTGTVTVTQIGADDDSDDGVDDPLDDDASESDASDLSLDGGSDANAQDQSQPVQARVRGVQARLAAASTEENMTNPFMNRFTNREANTSRNCRISENGRISGNIAATRYSELMESLEDSMEDSMVDSMEDSMEGKKIESMTPMRRAVVAGVRAVVAHLRATSP